MDEDLNNLVNPQLPSPYEVNNIHSLYWDAYSLSCELYKTPTDLYIHMNIQVLSAKFDLLQLRLNTLSHENLEKFPKIIALSETWLCEANEQSFK